MTKKTCYEVKDYDTLGTDELKAEVQNISTFKQAYVNAFTSAHDAAEANWDPTVFGVPYPDSLDSPNNFTEEPWAAGGDKDKASKVAPLQWTIGVSTYGKRTGGYFGAISGRATDLLNSKPTDEELRALLKEATGARDMYSFKCTEKSVEEIAQSDYDTFLNGIRDEKGVGHATAMDAMKVDGKTEAEWQKEHDDMQLKCTKAGGKKKDPVSCAAYEAADAALAKFEATKDQVSADVAGGVDIDYKEQCFLLAHIYGLANYKKILDQTPAFKKTKTLPYVQTTTADGGKWATNATLLAEGDPWAFINKLTQDTKTKGKFFEMESSEISALQPMIRLYKVVTDDSGTESEIEMSFDSNYTKTDFADFTSHRKTRGHGVGIKSFNFSFEANNPFALKKSIKAKLVLHANSFDELFRERTVKKGQVGSGKKYSYVDLALKTGRSSTGKTKEPQDKIESVNVKERDVVLDNHSKLMFRLKAIVGWATPGSHALFGGDDKKDLKRAIDRSHITLNLTPTIHEFNVDEQGRVEFVLNYLAYVEDFFDQPNYNIFSDKVITKKLLARKLKYINLNEACKAKEISELKSAEKDAKRQEINRAMQSLIQRLIGARKVQYVSIPMDILTAYQKAGPLGQMPVEFRPEQYFQQILGQQPTTVAAGTPDAKAIMTEMKARVAAGDDPIPSVPVDFVQTLSFFYASDLIDVILGGIQGTLEGMSAIITSISDSVATPEQKAEQTRLYKRYLDNFQKMRVVLGPMEVINPKAKGGVIQSNFICMGDVPISVRYFMEWLTKKMLKKDQATYSLPKFLNDFFNEFLRTFLNNDTCFNNEAKQSTRLAQSSLTAYADTKRTVGPTGYTDEITDLINRGKKSADFIPGRLYTNNSEISLPILSTYGDKANPKKTNPGFDKEIHYLVYYVARTQPTERMTGTRGIDHPNGIWHYEIGRPRGIVKTIDLTKTDSPGLKELRFEQQGYDGLQQLREMYDAKIQCYADVSAFPGTYIYIDPAGFSPSAKSHGVDLTQYGIGGYYMIIRSEHAFGAGQANTTITAKWVAELDAKASNEIRKLNKENSTAPSSAKCYAGKNKNQTSAREEAGIFASAGEWYAGTSLGKLLTWP